jgi:exodeoxyribonuclease V alpha subunit
VLAAHRRGPFGVLALVPQIERALARARLLTPGPEAYDGRPVLVTANDYALGLFNGDAGVTCLESGHLSVAFPGENQDDGALVRRLSPARMPPHETLFAMTIHKSQGSEHDAVVIVLPEATSPLLTRELLYTAVTRARSRAIVVGSEASVRAAIDRRVERASGLASLLWDA